MKDLIRETSSLLCLDTYLFVYLRIIVVENENQFQACILLQNHTQDPIYFLNQLEYEVLQLAFKEISNKNVQIHYM